MANLDDVALVRRGTAAVEMALQLARAARFDCRGADLTSVNLTGADLSSAILTGARLIGAKLAGVNLGWTSLERADLSGANLDGARLTGARINYANLNGASLVGANLAQASLVSSTLNNSNLCNASLRWASARKAEMTQAVLRNADLRQADLQQAELGGSDLRGADLSHSNVSRACLSGADLTQSRMRSTCLRQSQLVGANLTDADLSQADLVRASLHCAIVDGARLRGTHLGSTILTDLDLGVAKDLGSAVHDAPSAISASTFKLSRGQLPVEFLEGCGLSGWEIADVELYQPDLAPRDVAEAVNRIGIRRLSKPIQTRPVFISYTHWDIEAVVKVETGLRSAGIQTWRDDHDVIAGHLETQIWDAMEERIVLVVLSDRALDSDWVRVELEHARDLAKKTGRHYLCPIALDDAWTKPRSPHWPERLMVQVRDYAVLNFSGWRSGVRFDEALRKLEAGIRKWY